MSSTENLILPDNSAPATAVPGGMSCNLTRYLKDDDHNDCCLHQVDNRITDMKFSHQHQVISTGVVIILTVVLLMFVSIIVCLLICVRLNSENIEIRTEIDRLKTAFDHVGRRHCNVSCWRAPRCFVLKTS